LTSPNGTQAVDRAAQLLIQVVHSGPVTFSELNAASGLAKSTTSRLLMALERNGLVQRDSRGGFRPGEVFVSYAWRSGAEAGLITVAQPFLERLGEATGETINLGVASSGMVEQIAQVDSTYLIGGTNWVGLSVPLHCAALGKVLLAHGAAELPPGRLIRRTGQTITSREALQADLAGVRRRGYAVTNEELEPGLVAVAAPVYRDGASGGSSPRTGTAGGSGPSGSGVPPGSTVSPRAGTVVAALSVSGPATRLTRARISAVATRCMAEASALSAVLGYRPGPNRRQAQKEGAA
jgi:IclR family transcriptional regulator, acetate operon repressor